MERTPEPELMDEMDQARAYSEADFAEPHERCADLFATWFAAQGLPDDARVLDLGCGPADVTVRIARRLPRAALVGVDGSEAMLSFGRERLLREGMTSRVKLARAFLPHDPPPPGPYHAVFSNSLLHHLHDPSVLWRFIRIHAPNAKVFVMDLMRPFTRADVDRLVDEHARGEPEVLRRDFYASLCAAFTLHEVREQVRGAGFLLSVDAVTDRHLVAAS